MAPSIFTLHIIAVIVAPTGQLAALSGNFFKPLPPFPPIGYINHRQIANHPRRLRSNAPAICRWACESESVL